MKHELFRLSITALLLLAGIFSIAQPALAQAQDNCPPPPGATDFPAPPVTAQHVAEGSASLKDFLLHATELTKKVSLEAATNRGPVFHLGCLVRQEGSPWRSGPVYTFKLTSGGRVLSHAKEMALSGGLLNRRIYGEMLLALGVSPTDVDNLGSPDAATAARAQAAVRSTLMQEPHAAFDAGPGASGYAAVYVSGFGAPIIMVAGFDMTSSHVAPEVLDYGDPAVTAADVVDRATLKAFVTEAGNYWVGLRETSDPDAVSKGKIIFRDVNGPWRHGNVYLYILDTRSNSVLIHAAFPDRFELRPLVPTARDGVTGEFILPQVLEAAKSSPEGGFVRYFFDDPSDDTDNADIPKLGYAREFTANVPRSGGTIPVRYIIGSGIYLSSPNVTAARHTNVIETVLPQVMRAMTAGTVDAVSGRIRQAHSGSGAAPARSFSFGGASTLSDILLANGQSLASGTFDPGRLLAGSSFVMPLNAAGGAGSGPMDSLTLWGSGDYRDISGGNLHSVGYDGDVVSANVGVDTRFKKNLLAGVSVAWARGMVDYTDPETVEGELTSTLTSVNPYAGWRSDGGTSLWATAGHGWGEVEIEESTGKQESDLTQQMVAAGASLSLMSSDKLFEGGATSLLLKGETAFTRADLDGAGTFESMKLYTSRQRVMFEGTHVQQLASGATFAPSLEFGMRYDGGDGETGRSLELGGGLRYSNPASGLTLEGRARTLFDHEGDYDEWGVSGLVALDPGSDGLGLALSVQPSWGYTMSGVRQMWNTGETWGASPMDRGAGRVDMRLAYGIGTAWGGHGVVTPYTEMSLSGAGGHYLSLGSRFDLGSWARMSLEGMHRQPGYGDIDHGIMLRSDMSW